MRTSEDSRKTGLYASECCGQELIFVKGDTFWRCPKCQSLCEWELLAALQDEQSLEVANAL